MAVICPVPVEPSFSSSTVAFTVGRAGVCLVRVRLWTAETPVTDGAV